MTAGAANLSRVTLIAKILQVTRQLEEQFARNLHRYKFVTHDFPLLVHIRL